MKFLNLIATSLLYLAFLISITLTNPQPQCQFNTIVDSLYLAQICRNEANTHYLTTLESKQFDDHISYKFDCFQNSPTYKPLLIKDEFLLGIQNQSQFRVTYLKNGSEVCMQNITFPTLGKPKENLNEVGFDYPFIVVQNSQRTQYIFRILRDIDQGQYLNFYYMNNQTRNNDLNDYRIDVQEYPHKYGRAILTATISTKFDSKASPRSDIQVYRLWKYNAISFNIQLFQYVSRPYLTSTGIFKDYIIFFDKGGFAVTYFEEDVNNTMSSNLICESQLKDIGFDYKIKNHKPFQFTQELQTNYVFASLTFEQPFILVFLIKKKQLQCQVVQFLPQIPIQLAYVYNRVLYVLDYQNNISPNDISKNFNLTQIVQVPQNESSIIPTANNQITINNYANTTFKNLIQKQTQRIVYVDRILTVSVTESDDSTRNMIIGITVSVVALGLKIFIIICIKYKLWRKCSKRDQIVVEQDIGQSDEGNVGSNKGSDDNGLKQQNQQQDSIDAPSLFVRSNHDLDVVDIEDAISRTQTADTYKNPERQGWQVKNLKQRTGSFYIPQEDDGLELEQE